MDITSLKAQNPLSFIRYNQVKNPSAILIVILVAAFLIRVYISFFTHLPHIHKDTPDYLKQATALANGLYINYFPNGYPLIIALEKLIFGNNIEPFLIWTNILLAVCVLYFVFQISKAIFSNNLLALVTTFLIAFFPSQINIVRWLTSEVPTTFFITGSYFFYVRKRFTLAGLFFGITTLIRTELILVFILLVLCELIMQKKINLKLIVGGIIPLLMLGYYCYFKTGTFSISGHGKVNIMYAVTASGSNIDYEYIHKHPEVVTDKDAMNEYLNHVKKEPVKYIRERLANLFELWGIPSASDGNRGNTSRLIMGSSNFFLIIFGIIGWWQNRNSFYASIIMIPFVVVTIVHTLLLAISRYTIPVEPFMMIPAGWILLKLFTINFRKKLIAL